MFTILDTVVDGALATTHFACDLGTCKGACCTMPGGRGAPLEDAEVDMIAAALPAALDYVPERNRAIIQAQGPIEGQPGDYATRCIDRRDCVFVHYEGDVAKCAIERAFFAGRTTFRKPLSCHLFPIRIDQLFDTAFLRYEQIRECRPALENGAREGVPLYRFLKDAITRAYGEAYYRELAERIERGPLDQ